MPSVVFELLLNMRMVMMKLFCPVDGTRRLEAITKIFNKYDRHFREKN